MIQTLAFNARLPVLLGASPFYRIPSSPIAHGFALTESDYVRARLTAMAIETDHFKREDIYTLFVSTRIINFFKGLPPTGSSDLLELLTMRWADARTQIGIDLLRRLRQTGELYVWTKSGIVQNRKFQPDLFAKVLLEAQSITCLNQQRITVHEYASGLGDGNPSRRRVNLLSGAA